MFFGFKNLGSVFCFIRTDAFKSTVTIMKCLTIQIGCRIVGFYKFSVQIKDCFVVEIHVCFCFLLNCYLISWASKKPFPKERKAYNLTYSSIPHGGELIIIMLIMLLYKFIFV